MASRRVLGTCMLVSGEKRGASLGRLNRTRFSLSLVSLTCLTLSTRVLSSASLIFLSYPLTGSLESLSAALSSTHTPRLLSHPLSLPLSLSLSLSRLSHSLTCAVLLDGPSFWKLCCLLEEVEGSSSISHHPLPVLSSSVSSLSLAH